MKCRRCLRTLCLFMLLVFFLVAGGLGQEPLMSSQAKGGNSKAGVPLLRQGGNMQASGSGWWIERVDSGSVGNHSSLALDSSGWPHISYYDFGNDDLKYAHKDASGWHIDSVDYAGYVGAFTSLALDSLDRPHISYCSCTSSSCSTCNDLKYAWHDGDDWHIEWAATTGNVGGYTSLVLVGDQPHISYYDFTNGDLEYTYKDTFGLPHSETVDSTGDVGRYTSLAVYAGHRYISYMDYNTDITKQHLKYAHHDGGTWHVETLDSGSTYTGAYSSLDLCKTYIPAAPRITYWRNGELGYAHKWFFGGWTYVSLFSDPPGPTSLALDSLCRVTVSYFELYNGDLRYSYQHSGGKQIETVDDEGDTWPYWSSLALDSSDRPYISYYDDSHFGLSYAYRAHVTHLPLVLQNH